MPEPSPSAGWEETSQLMHAEDGQHHEPDKDDERRYQDILDGEYDRPEPNLGESIARRNAVMTEYTPQDDDLYFS
jgi:hypothetical protein